MLLLIGIGLGIYIGLRLNKESIQEDLAKTTSLFKNQHIKALKKKEVKPQEAETIEELQKTFRL